MNDKTWWKVIALVLAVGCGGKKTDEPVQPPAKPAPAPAVTVQPIAIDAAVVVEPPTPAMIAEEAKNARNEAARAAASKNVTPKPSHGRAAREGFVEEFASMAAHDGLKFSVSLGDPDTTLQLIGNCNAKVLEIFAEMVATNARNVGFTTLACASGGASRAL